jgi:hypothetical protein
MPLYSSRSAASCTSVLRDGNGRSPISLRLLAFVGVAALITLGGCHSAYVNATVMNQTPTAISVVQVEYPSASFGTQTIAAGQEFHYRFKVLGSGALKITYTDTKEAEHKSSGPTLNEGTEGAVKITVAPDGVHWDTPPAK